MARQDLELAFMILHQLSRARLAVTQGLWFQDGSDYYRARVALDSMTGAYLWTTQGPEVCPTDSVNIADLKCGPTFWMLGEDNTYHAFRMTATDPPVMGFAWTDFEQTSTRPVPLRTVRNARVDGGLYITDSYGEQFHKMTISGALFTEENQGVTIPL
jgi:hypothetical protein